MNTPLIIAEIGINHDGVIERAFRMIQDAHNAGCEVVKFQCHVLDDPYGEYVPAARNIIPSNATESIYDIMARCALSEEQERSLKEYTESLGMMYLSTPFSRAAADRLERLGVSMYKIGSGECNNYPLIEHITAKGKPIVLSTGMNTLPEIDRAVDIIGDQLYAILHCVSMYPAPYDRIHLGALKELRLRYGKRIGLSDHSIGIYTALAGVALGAEVVEKHFVSDKSWPGPDVPISITPAELRELIEGAKAIKQSLSGVREVASQRATADFAFASVCSIRDIHPGERFTPDNIWVKRPGTGISAANYENVLGKLAEHYIPKDTLLIWEDISYS